MGFTSRAARGARTTSAVHMGNGTLPDGRWHVATAANRGYVGLLLNWLLHVKPHGSSIGQLVIVADDHWTYRVLSSVAELVQAELRCENVTIRWTGQDVNEPTRFGSRHYKYMMARRPMQILSILNGTASYHTPWVWSDADAVFVSNPFPELAFPAEGSPTYHLHHIMEEPRYGSGKLTRDPRISAGFMAMRNVPKVRELMQAWADDMAVKARFNTSWERSNEGNQNSYRKVWLRFRKSVHTRALPGDSFLNGFTFFVNHTRWPDCKVAHATHVTGLAPKIALMQAGGIWRCSEAAQWLQLSEAYCHTHTQS
jgi:hypothetical protein